MKRFGAASQGPSARRRFGQPCAGLPGAVSVSVVNDDFSDATLVLIGHGSTVSAESGAPVYQHAAALRNRHLFTQVLEGFWKQEPRVTELINRVSAPRVFVVPLFVSDGYFSDEVIPRELGFSSQAVGVRTLRRGSQTLYYGRAVGEHPGMTRIILARAEETLEQHPFPRRPKPGETALVIAGHGTDRNENSRGAVERQIALLRAQNSYAEVHGVYLEEAPRVGDCYQMTAAKNLVVVPFFISDGKHTREDIPVLLGEAPRVVQERLNRGHATWRNPTERNGKRVWYSRSVGTDPGVAEVILERVREAGVKS